MATVLAELDLVKFDDRWLATWIERNLGDPNALMQIAENLGLFGPEIAELLEFRLNQHPATLPDYLRLSWTLIIRRMRNAKQGKGLRCATGTICCCVSITVKGRPIWSNA
jgi:hypothetical protein